MMNYDKWLQDHVHQRMMEGGNGFAKEVLKTKMNRVLDEATKAILEKEGRCDNT